MKIKLPSLTSKNLLITILIASLFLSSTNNSLAAVNDRVRTTKIDGNGRCIPDGDGVIGFLPLEKTQDMTWELDNPTCIGYMVGSGVAVQLAGLAASGACVQTQMIASIAASAAAGVAISPMMAFHQASFSTGCSAFASACSSGVAASCSPASQCCGALTFYVAAIGAAVIALDIIYDLAKQSELNAHICGDLWNTWKTVNIADEYPYYKGVDREKKMDIPVNKDGSIQGFLEEEYQSGGLELNPNTPESRQYLYGGIEYEDNGENACKNPTGWDDAKKLKQLGYTTKNQRYYMRGPGMAPNYACSRFASEKNDDSAKKAYECCTERSQNTICIEVGSPTMTDFTAAKVSMTVLTGKVAATTPNTAAGKTSYKFCKLGEKCEVNAILYSTYRPSKPELQSYICAQTYSVCPYNHPLGGGTEIIAFDEEDEAVQLNKCQYLKHCVKTPIKPYIRSSSLSGGWISSACFDLKGDSQNEYGYTSELIPINTKQFSAPIAQCFKETLENMLINKAGNTKCLDPDENPDSNDSCSSGYLYKKGMDIKSEKSFFQTIQNSLQNIIKIVMTLSVTLMGIMVLLSGSPWDKKTLLMFIVKLGLVAFFALGNAWQDHFFSGISRISTSIAGIFMQVDQHGYQDANGDGIITRAELEVYDSNAVYRDGCQFPRFNYVEKNSDDSIKYKNPAYPPGTEYLQIWDMLDCKIARALGFSLNVSVPNLLMMILAGFFTGGLGIIFFVATFVFAFYLIALTVRALHIFLIASMAITLMIYVSPITITASLFKRTQGIFNNWKTNLISFILQPVILFAYLGILITLFEKTIIGDATFSGDGLKEPKKINCSTGNAENNSIYCIFRFANLDKNNALTPIGISVPVLRNMNDEKMMTIFKAALLMFIFSKFLDKINDLSQRLFGGQVISSGSQGALQMLGKAHSIAKGVQSRGTNATRKWGVKAAKGAARGTSSVAKGIGNAGKIAAKKAGREKPEGNSSSSSNSNDSGN